MRFLEWFQSTGKILQGNNYLWSMMKKSSVSRMQRFVFSDSALCLGKVNQNPISKTVWEEQLGWFKDSPQYRTSDTIDGEPMEFEWKISQDSPHCSSSTKSKSSWPNGSDPSQFKRRIIFMSMFDDIKWGSEDNERECIANATLVTLFAKRFPPRRWSFLGPGSEKKWYSTQRKTTRRMGQSRWIDDDQIQRKRTPSFPSHESIIQRSAQKQRRRKIVNTLLCRWRYV